MTFFQWCVQFLAAFGVWFNSYTNANPYVAPTSTPIIVYITPTPNPLPTPSLTPAPSPTPIITSTPSPMPSPAPSLIPTATPTNFNVQQYALTLPNPLAVTIPVLQHLTATAIVQCNSTSTGSTIMASLNSWSLEAGSCNGLSNPITAQGLHIFDAVSNIQASPAIGLVAGKTYLVAMSQDGLNLSLYVCSLPGGICSKTSTKDAGNLAPSSNLIIGSSFNGVRTINGKVWDAAIYPVLTDTQIQQISDSAEIDLLTSNATKNLRIK